MDVIKPKKSFKPPPFNAQWMGSVLDNLPLCRIVMPGSHDAGMNELCSHWGGFALASTIKTQALSIYEQLCSGSRFFDLRVYMHESVARTGHFMERRGHGNADFGSFGQHLDDVLNDVARFMYDHHKTEVVILRFSHTDPKAVPVVVQRINDFLGKFLFSCNPNTNLAQVQLKDLRGKVLPCCEFMNFAKHIDPRAGLHAFGVPTSTLGAAWLATCGLYDKEVHTSLDGMLDLATRGILEHQAHPPGDHLGLVYWQITGGDVRKNTKQAHKVLQAPGNPVHSLMKPLLMRHFPRHSDINIVMLDFVEPDICARIFNLNILGFPALPMLPLPQLPQ